ncbi:MAG: Ig-like domain-containing protein [Treponema sp.]|jgi:hypothetical protein|nr:Ig-like domain-containing protein [Treponema sp.]
MKKLNIFVYGFLMLLLASCDLFRGSPYEVIAWTPGNGFHEAENLVVSLLLSHSGDRVKTEQSFSLSEDGRPIKGTFQWNDRQLIFVPSSPLEENRDYLISLGTGAQNEKGLSLENKFLASFTTRAAGGRPSVISTMPSDGIITGPRECISISFCEPVTINSCTTNISFVPAITGSWRLDDTGKLASFHPLEPWKTGIRYRVNINSGFTCINGRNMGEDYYFYVNTVIKGDQEKPVLLSVYAIDLNGEAFEIETDTWPWSGITEYAEWDSSFRLRLDFSKRVDVGSVKNRLSVEPYASMVMETQPGMSNSVIFRFAEKPAWQSSFLFKLNTGIRDEVGNETDELTFFRIRAANENSKPPYLVGIRLPLAPGKSCIEEQFPQIFTPNNLYADFKLDFEEIYLPYVTNIDFWVEFYFDTAPDTRIDIFSLMDLFRMEITNRAISFSPRHIEINNFTWPEPVQGWEAYDRVEMRGFLSNNVRSGVVIFSINSGLKDARGNKSMETFRISLLK